MAWVDGLFRFQARGEQQRCKGTLFVFLQNFHHRQRNDDGSECRLGFRFADGDFPAHHCGLFADAELAGLEIQIVPCERQYFTPTQACGQFQKEEFVQTFFFGLYQKPLDFLFREDLHFFLLGLREPDTKDGIFLDEAIFDRAIQRHADHQMAQPNGAF